MLIDIYNELYKNVKAITDSIATAESSMVNAAVRKDTEIPARISTLEEQLIKIDDYMAKIEQFRRIAEEHLESRNLLTIEAPPGYRVNLNRLRNWAMMIDPMSSNDPYAQRVYLTARCDECFLEKKKQEFIDRIALLKGDEAMAIDTLTDEQKAVITEMQAKLSELAGSAEVAGFAKSVDEENIAKIAADGKYAGTGYWYEIVPEIYASPTKQAEFIALGAFSKPLGFPEEQRPLLKQLFGEFYREKGGRVLLPSEMSTDREFAISIACTPARTKALDRGLQNFILNIINRYPAGENKVVLIDAVRYNSTALGSLKQLEDTFAIERLPRNPEQMSSLLEKIVSGFSDMDDMLEMYDSVVEYNEKVESTKRLSRTTLILFGWPSAFEGRDREFIQRIMTNYERYGISFINISFSADGKAKNSHNLPEYTAHTATYINMLPKETVIHTGDNAPQSFIWYYIKSELPQSFVDTLKEIKIDKKVLGNIYTERCNTTDITSTREYRAINLPFGVDGKDQLQYVQFENENFATYLVGASRSGKSTLLHTLIAGIISNYHPDNVELWLADFKQLEFKLYIDNCPPHVKYVLLDESTELVYNLVDKLTEKMMERQRIFARLGVDKIKDVKFDDEKISEPMPIIFVILDEFSIMSQVIAESQYYRLRLQNLLAKGAALGIRFLFASQSFQTGIAGLTQTAKNQIQQRIAMKAPREEIVETLELTPNLKTEQVTNWMDALPPHYALAKYRTGEDAMPQVMRVHVLFFPPENRDEMIIKIANSYNKVNSYTPTKNENYVDKNPIFIDGNTFNAYNDNDFIKYIEHIRVNNADDYTGEETFMSLGTPRLMTNMKAVAITQEARENILLIGRSTEQASGAAIISAAIKSYLAQGKRAQVWAYEKNRLFLTYRQTPWETEEYSAVLFKVGMSNVCDAIREVKENIHSKTMGNDLIILIGMERICADFEFIEHSESNAGTKSTEKIQLSHEEKLRKQGALIESALDQLKADTVNELAEISEKIRKKAKKEKKSEEETEALIKDAKEKLYAEKRKLAEELQSRKTSEHDMQDTADLDDSDDSKDEHKPSEHKLGEYNAFDDFQYIIKQGSRNGYNFLLYLNSYSDLKQTMLKLDMFRHRLAFQVSDDDSRELFGNKNASSLPEHICQYYDTLEKFSFRPYLHKGIGWEGWYVDEDGNAVDPSAVDI